MPRVSMACPAEDVLLFGTEVSPTTATTRTFVKSWRPEKICGSTAENVFTLPEGDVTSSKLTEPYYQDAMLRFRS